MNTSGMKQNHRGELYMERRLPNGIVETIPISTKLNLGIIKELQLTNGTNSHTFTWDEDTEKFTNNRCGVFGCAVCDIENLSKRMDKFRERETA